MVFRDGDNFCKALQKFSQSSGKSYVAFNTFLDLSYFFLSALANFSPKMSSKANHEGGGGGNSGPHGHGGAHGGGGNGNPNGPPSHNGSPWNSPLPVSKHKRTPLEQQQARNQSIQQKVRSIVPKLTNDMHKG
jgi:hypothetical protein